MVQRLYGFLVVSLLMFSGEVFGQQNPCDSSKKSAVIPQISKKVTLTGDCWNLNPVVLANPEEIIKLLKLPIVYNKLANFNFENLLRLDNTVKDTVIQKTVSPLFLFKPSSLPSYTSHLGFFCKQELQLDKITSVPLRFRLGSLEYVNWMDQKPNTLNPK
jgi:hypothetical protein